MRKIIVFNMLSVDGCFCGPKGEIGWHNVDSEFNDFAIRQLRDEVGLLLFGRTTYDLMASYWTSAQAIKNDPVVAGLMNQTDKIIFSKSLGSADWENTQIINDIERLKIERLKQETDKDIFIFGSGQVIQQIAKLGLIDEYRLMVNPVILGAGKPLFTASSKLKLLKAREFKNGNVLLSYEPA